MKIKISISIAVLALLLVTTTSNVFSQSNSTDTKLTGKTVKVEKQTNPAPTTTPRCCDESKRNASQCTEKEKAACKEIQKKQEIKEAKVEQKVKKINKNK